MRRSLICPVVEHDWGASPAASVTVHSSHIGATVAIMLKVLGVLQQAFASMSDQIVQSQKTYHFDAHGAHTLRNHVSNRVVHHISSDASPKSECITQISRAVEFWKCTKQ